MTYITRYPWHPHSSYDHNRVKPNAIYVPTEKLSICPEQKGYGTLSYRPDRILTMENKTRGIWKELSFLMPEKVYGSRKNSSKDGGLYYAGIWQELVVYESEGLIDWVKSIIK